MFLERTISQLDIGPMSHDEATELGQLGYLQWLAGLPADAGYAKEAMHAYATARPFLRSSPALAVFCELLVASTRDPFAPLPLKMPKRERRGGARARRFRRMIR